MFKSWFEELSCPLVLRNESRVNNELKVVSKWSSVGSTSDRTRSNAARKLYSCRFRYRIASNVSVVVSLVAVDRFCFVEDLVMDDTSCRRSRETSR